MNINKFWTSIKIPYMQASVMYHQSKVPLLNNIKQEKLTYILYN